MENKINYTVIGAIGFFLICAAIIIVFWLSSHHKHVNYKNCVSYFSEEVTGLNNQSIVRYNGVQAGFVSAIAISSKDLQKVIVYMKIKNSIPITTATYAMIESDGFTGGKYIGLRSHKATAPMLHLISGEKNIVIPSEASFFSALESSVKGIITQLNTVIVNINKLLSNKNRQSISDTLSDIREITRNIANDSGKIDKSLADLQKILENTATVSKKFPELISRTRKTLRAFEKTANTFSKTGKKASGALNQTGILMQNINSQLLPSARQLFDQLNVMVNHFSTLGNELSHNPSIIIRGRYPLIPGPGEKSDDH